VPPAGTLPAEEAYATISTTTAPFAVSASSNRSKGDRDPAVEAAADRGLVHVRDRMGHCCPRSRIYLGVAPLEGPHAARGMTLLA
jgi:hypothetical protein